MAIYRYEAVDKDGKVYRGAMDAKDEQAVVQRLNMMGYSMKAIMPAQQTAQPATAPSAPRSAKTATVGEFPVSVSSCVRMGALVRFYRQLATMVRAGMPLVQSLGDLEDATANRKLRRSCIEMRERVQMGQSLSSTMAAHPRLFPVHTVGLIWAGEQGGYLDIALDEAAKELEQEAKDNRLASVGWFLVKASIFSLILLLPMWDVGGFFIRVSEESLKRAAGGGELASVNVQQAINSMLTVYWQSFIKMCIPAFVIWIVLAYAWGQLKRTASVRRLLDAAILMIPNWGAFHRDRARERFLRTLHRQYEAGVSPAQGWAAASMSIRNSELAGRMRNIDELLRQPGMTLQSAMAQSRVFSLEDSNMIGTGERSGSVPEMLQKTADYHGESVARTKTAGRVISINLMVLGTLIVTGYFVIQTVAGFYRAFAHVAGLE